MKQLFHAPLLRVFLLLSLSAGAFAQAQTGSDQTPPPVPAQVDKNAQEMTTKEAPALFKARVNLVMVPVVVRDSKGKALGTLTKESFQLFDKGKPQEITRFSLEKGAPKPINIKDGDTIPTTGDDTPLPPDIPDRFVAYLFDDVHLQFGDLVRVRDAASRQIAQLPKTERAAIYTTSGQNQVDFTGDIDKLQQDLLRIRTHSITDPAGFAQCPDINYYMADMIQNKNDVNALNLGIQEVMSCTQGMTADGAKGIVQAAAQRALSTGMQESRISLIVLKDLVRRMSVMPGQRIIVMLSPGFITPELQQDKSDIMDKAIHSNVLINSLDARGLWTDPSLDASNPGRTSNVAFGMLKRQYDREAASAQADVLAEMGYGTGGSFFQNSNDLDRGLRELVAAPDFYYILGFSPQNLKLDGSFHSLKVSLKPPVSGTQLQARKGYYAPKKLSSAEENAKEEIEQALFSRDEMVELPVELHTRYFKSSDKDATISVLAKVDARHVPFRKADGRNFDILTVVAGIFDRDGNFISGIQKTVDLKLKDETLGRLLASGGMTIKTDFSVGPGTYMVRLVVRDSEGQLMAAQNGAVAIQ